jgi:hypothetical protein
MRLISYVRGELIPLPSSGSIPELPHVAEVGDDGQVGAKASPLKRSSASALVEAADLARCY